MVCLIFKGILTNNQESIPPKTLDDIGKHRFSREFSRVFFSIFPSFFQHFLSLFSLFSPKCDTCDSKKTTLRLERARLRVYARNTHRKFSLYYFSHFPFFLFPAFLVPSFFLSYQSFLLLSPSFFFFLLLSCFLRSLSLSPSSLLGRVIQYFKISYLLFLYCSFGVIQRGKCSFPRFLHALGQYLPIYK